MIEITLNGESQKFSEPLTALELLRHLDLAGKRVAIELNGEILPKSAHGQTPLKSGDVLEIVVAVGGG